jgi:Flp pilus assembly pilin Flp
MPARRRSEPLPPGSETGVSDSSAVNTFCGRIGRRACIPDESRGLQLPARQGRAAAVTGDKTMCEHHDRIGLWTRLRRDEDGATAIEYVVLVSLVALAITLSVRSLGFGVNQSFADSAAIFEAAGAD